MRSLILYSIARGILIGSAIFGILWARGEPNGFGVLLTYIVTIGVTDFVLRTYFARKDSS